MKHALSLAQEGTADLDRNLGNMSSAIREAKAEVDRLKAEEESFAEGAVYSEEAVYDQDDGMQRLLAQLAAERSLREQAERKQDHPPQTTPLL